LDSFRPHALSRTNEAAPRARGTTLIRVISYNLRKNHASGELVDLAVDFGLDVLCLQECDTMDLPAEVGPLHLADSTKRNRLGLAVYYRRDRFTAVATKTFALKKSLHDRVLAPAHERLIGTRLVDNATGREVVVASFHAAPLTALNSLRRNQINAAHAELHTLGEGIPILMVGDYNYPFFTKKLGSHVRESGYDLTLSDQRTYTRYKFFSGHFDFATSVGLTIDSVETLPSGDSDHMPILISADYTSEPAAA
jgi:endonuclease/exonuclease/phosphatase family metal-dependent hydrolase